MKNPNTKICPQQNCKQGVVDLLLQPPQCRQCRTKYCAECMMKVHSGPCDKNFEGKFRQWKRCPKCRLFINKDGGCNHIICRCNHQFCFVCLQNWNDDHYQCIDVQQLRGPLRDCMSKIPLISFIVLLICVPIFIGVALLLGAIGLAIALVLGMIGAPLILIRQKKWPIVIVLLLLPLIMVIGGLAIMIVTLIMIYRPFIGRLFSVYKRMLQSLWADAFYY